MTIVSSNSSVASRSSFVAPSLSSSSTINLSRIAKDLLDNVVDDSLYLNKDYSSNIRELVSPSCCSVGKLTLLASKKLLNPRWEISSISSRETTYITASTPRSICLNVREKSERSDRSRKEILSKDETKAEAYTADLTKKNSSSTFNPTTEPSLFLPRVLHENVNNKKQRLQKEKPRDSKGTKRKWNDVHDIINGVKPESPPNEPVTGPKCVKHTDEKICKDLERKIDSGKRLLEAKKPLPSPIGLNSARWRKMASEKSLGSIVVKRHLIPKKGHRLNSTTETQTTHVFRTRENICRDLIQAIYFLGTVMIALLLILIGYYLR